MNTFSSDWYMDLKDIINVYNDQEDEEQSGEVNYENHYIDTHEGTSVPKQHSKGRWTTEVSDCLFNILI